jgi:predicted MFS family arabinose efflux permease
LIGYVCSTIALGSLISLWKTGMSGIMFRVILLSVMFVSTFYTGLCIGSTARDLKAQMRTTEEGEKKEELRQQFSKLHRRSMIMNVLILILGVITLFMTAAYMRPKGAY